MRAGGICEGGRDNQNETKLKFTGSSKLEVVRDIHHPPISRASATMPDAEESRLALILELMSSLGHASSLLVTAASVSRALRADEDLWSRLVCASFAEVRAPSGPRPAMHIFRVALDFDEPRFHWLLRTIPAARLDIINAALLDALRFRDGDRKRLPDEDEVARRDSCARALLMRGASLGEAVQHSVGVGNFDFFRRLGAALLADVLAHPTASPTVRFLLACGNDLPDMARQHLLEVLPADDDDGLSGLDYVAKDLPLRILKVLVEHPVYNSMTTKYHIAALGGFEDYARELISAHPGEADPAALCAALACGCVPEAIAILHRGVATFDNDNCFGFFPSNDSPMRWAAEGAARPRRGVFAREPTRA